MLFLTLYIHVTKQNLPKWHTVQKETSGQTLSPSKRNKDKDKDEESAASPKSMGSLQLNVNNIYGQAKVLDDTDGDTDLEQLNPNTNANANHSPNLNPNSSLNKGGVFIKLNSLSESRQTSLPQKAAQHPMPPILPPNMQNIPESETVNRYTKPSWMNFSVKFSSFIMNHMNHQSSSVRWEGR